MARGTGRQQAKAGSKRSPSATIAETQEGEYDFENEHEPQESDTYNEEDLEVDEAVEELRDRLARVRCRNCGEKKGPHLFTMDSPQSQCLECTHTWVPQGILYQDELLKTVHGKTATRLLGVHYNMWLDSDSQRRKAID